MTPGGCIGTPVSWLRLEQYVLDELSAPRRRDVEQHLRACAVCRACLELAGGDSRAIAPRPAPRWPVARRHVALMLSAAAVFGAALLYFRAPRHEEANSPIPPPRIAIKGGELAIELVRERDGVQRFDPEHFQLRDRFRVRITCPPGLAARWEVIVFQGGEASFPLEPAPLTCGNAVALPGAFVLTENEPATVCLVLDPPARDALRATRATELPGTLVCRTLQPGDD